MILYIAEKPSLGRAVANALPKPHKNADGFITLANGDVVSWCIGHMLEQAQPEVYHSDYKKWRIEHLPIIPDEWKLVVKKNTRKQFSILKKLIKQADLLVNIGDPDREGQILVDEVINHCRVSKAKKALVKRCLINDLNPKAVSRSLNNLKNNSDFIALATSALARARADWLYGINMTRLCTINGQKSGFKGVLSIGRVQTPLLGLVVRRDLEIEKFVSKPFYVVEVNLETEQSYQFVAKWKPSSACEPYMDEEGRVLSRKLAENVVSRVVNQSGNITRVDEKIVKQPAPLPYNLSALQIDAAKKYGFSAKQVLETCQQLYERHKVITYPRSDCRYLPESHFFEVERVVKAISSTVPDLQDITTNADISRKSRAWNDKKVGAHHAIIPTQKMLSSDKLSNLEVKIYELIARQYLAQFYPTFDYRQVQVNVSIVGGTFIAKRKEILSLGWKYALPKPKGKNKKEEFSKSKMPLLQRGDSVFCNAANIIDKQTTPPKYFTDASLLAAMTGIARYVSDQTIIKILRETDGLGTEATRANIIELLFTRKFLVRKGKDIRATDIGRELISSLPDSVASPDMTAHWESQLEAISMREIKYTHFMEPMTESLRKLISEVDGVYFDGLRGKGQTVNKWRRKKKTKKNSD